MIPTLAGFLVGVSAPPPPAMLYHSTGKFRIDGYSPTLVYTATLVSGSGTAALDPVTGIFTLSGANSRFSVTSRYAPSAPESEQRFIERKAYTYYTESYTFPTTCTGTRSVPYDCSYQSQEQYYCCGDPCVPTYSLGIVVAWNCPPTDGWFCQTNYQCCTYQCVRTVTVPRTCYRDESYTYACTGTATRQVRNATPSGYIDSGVEWYRLS